MSSDTQISQPKPADVASTTSHVAPAPPEPFAWRSWPLVDDFRAVLPLALLAISLIALIAVETASIGNVIFAVAIVVVASWRIWMPVRYEVNSFGVVRSCLGRARRVGWSA